MTRTVVTVLGARDTGWSIAMPAITFRGGPVARVDLGYGCRNCDAVNPFCTRTPTRCLPFPVPRHGCTSTRTHRDPATALL